MVCPVVLGRPPNRRWYEFHGERDWHPRCRGSALIVHGLLRAEKMAES